MRARLSMAFAENPLDRALAPRQDPEALARLRADPRARWMVLWRGRVPVRIEGEGRERRARLVLLGADAPLLAEAGAPEVFLGLADGAPRFARPLEGWTPPGVDPAQLEAFFDPGAHAHPRLGKGGAFTDLRAVMTRLPPEEAELAALARGLLVWHAGHGFCPRCGAATEAAAAGWQRRCTGCGRVQFPRTDPVVITLVTHGERVLLGRSHGWPEGMYSLLAGFVEPGETIEAAARREVAEETGVPIGPVQVLASQPWPWPASLMIGCAAEATDTRIRLDADELEDARWVGRSELLAALAGAPGPVRPPRPGAIASWLIGQWLAGRLRPGVR